MKVLIDGEEVEVLNDVKIIYEGLGLEEDEQLHITATSEGLIHDVFDFMHILGTQSATAEEIRTEIRD